ncbi:MAG TPA: CBS domain-containing protein [Gammaproteobacteria bacterium]|nr:CBS domain-containing protein [Gammaproteobacteria bacterium]
MSEARRLAETFLALHPGEAGAVLEGLAPEAAAGLCADLPPADAARALAGMVPAAAAAILGRLPEGSAADLLGHMPPGATAGILRCFIPEDRAEWLDALPATQRARVALMLGQAPDTLGAWVDTRIPAVRREATVAEACDRFREGTGGCGLVVLDGDRRPMGVVPLARLLDADPETPVSRLADRGVPILPAGVGLAQARAVAGWREYGVLPVVDRHGRFLGGLTGARLEQALAPHAAPQVPSGGEALATLTGTYLRVLAGLLQGLWAVFTPGEPRDGGGRHDA